MYICFLTKKEKPFVDEAINHLNKIATKIDIYDGSVLKSFPNEIEGKKYDIIISYISSWIIPNSVLKRTKRWNINFHPGPPEFPGTGCFNFAIYNSSKKYGCTANIMDPKVDTGEIIAVKRFPIKNNESVATLSKKTYKTLSLVLKDVISSIHSTNSLPKTNELWMRKPYKRTDLEKLCEIDSDMSKDEINLRIRSTYFYGKPAPFIKINGKKFEFNPKR